MHSVDSQARRLPALVRSIYLAPISLAGVLAAPATAAADLQVAHAVTASGIAPDGTDRVEYAMEVRNAGTDPAEAVKVLMRLPEEFVAPAWTCVAEGGAQCGTSTGAGDILFVTDMAAGARLRFRLDTAVMDVRERGVETAIEAISASPEANPDDNGAFAFYRRCSASAPLASGEDPPPHPCAFLDGFEQRG